MTAGIHRRDAETQRKAENGRKQKGNVVNSLDLLPLRSSASLRLSGEESSFGNQV